MGIHEYIEKQRARPEHERNRLAVVWTAIGFAIILVIWVISFREMSKPVDTQVDPASANLNDLRNDFQNNLDTGKDSIQDMMQNLPASPTGGSSQPGENEINNENSVPYNDNMDANDSPGNQDGGQDNQSGASVPQLP
jgi:hypothetical protein